MDGISHFSFAESFWFPVRQSEAVYMEFTNRNSNTIGSNSFIWTHGKTTIQVRNKRGKTASLNSMLLCAQHLKKWFLFSRVSSSWQKTHSRPAKGFFTIFQRRPMYEGVGKKKKSKSLGKESGERYTNEGTDVHKREKITNQIQSRWCDVVI